MGLALPAELNGYPGPVHVLELGEKLALTGEQRTRVEELHAAMKGETVPLGERLIAQETDLDRQFATKSVTSASLQAATADIGATQGALRGAHLRYHLSTLDVLTPEQVRRYSELRGYQASGGQGHAPRATTDRSRLHWDGASRDREMPDVPGLSWGERQGTIHCQSKMACVFSGLAYP
ncbi:Spy/CpxP family protein refolding chaperone [Microvirga splendida]|uniref:Uncharacterized protein n=1 Tax=Microvirga splendida TaxID=2795727 RepID=A0ABS0Y7X3_9HYPH|nr:hypothetical protein [Microvirga splendida]MBJ6128411.1 hypothetical protein [Microvirga splendida]